MLGEHWCTATVQRAFAAKPRNVLKQRQAMSNVRPLLTALVLTLALTRGATAAPPATGPSADSSWPKNVAQSMDVYGRLDGQLAFTKDDVKIANNSSRIGFK